jgi:tRNA modification GTPase
VVRISGPRADEALERLAGRLPEPRQAGLALLSADGEHLDTALAIRFPGPHSATGEDVAELHLHGGRAVVAAVLEALAAIEGLRPAAAGEFTRRAFENGRIDLAEAEGLADLLAAETQSQHRAALAMAGGTLSRLVEGWQARLLALSAALEAALDFSDEGEVGEGLPPTWAAGARELVEQIQNVLSAPPVERLRDGIRAVIAGPPNAGKSSLLNALAGREAAITSALAGTTRDLVEAPTGIGGIPFLLVDTAGLRDGRDEVESLGIDRARASLAAADLVIWLGSPKDAPDPRRSIVVQAKSDLTDRRSADADVAVSVVSGEGMDLLVSILTERSRVLLPAEADVAVNARQRAALAEASAQLGSMEGEPDLLVAAEAMRQARLALDRVTGRAGVEDMLDALFGRFCIGK